MVTLLVPPGGATAQDAISNVRQSEAYTFGQALRFSIEAQATTIFTKAQLTLTLTKRTERIVETPEVPRSASLTLTHEVDVQSYNIPPFAEVTYRWELTTLGGATHTTEPRTFRYEDNRVGWAWQTEQRANVVVHWDGEEEGVAQIALDVAGESLARTEKLLGTTSSEDIHVYIYPDLHQLTSGLRLHNRNLQDWVTALAIPDQSVVVLSAAAGPGLYVDLTRDLPHELTHIMLYRAAGDNAERIPAWYNEGLAIISSAEPDAALRVTLESAARKEELLPLESLCVESYAALQPTDAALAYAQSESVMRYVLDRFGSVGARNLLVAHADGASCKAGVERALGISLNSLENEWRTDLRRDVLAQTSAMDTLLPWLMLWGGSLALALLFIALPPRLRETAPEEPPPIPSEMGKLPELP